VQYKVAKFSFDSVNIGDGVTYLSLGITPSTSMLPGMPPSMPYSMPMAPWAMVCTKVYLKQETSAVEVVVKAWSDNTSYQNVAPKHGTGPTHIVGTSPFNSGGSRKKGGTLSGLVAGTAAGGGGYGGEVPAVRPRADRTIREPTQFPGRLMAISMWMPC
jgi:hypothetical protein